MKAPGNLFVVDDDPMSRKAAKALASSLKIHCESFASAEEFLDRYSPSLTGCLLLDYRLGGMDGLQLQERLCGMGSLLRGPDQRLCRPVVGRSRHAESARRPLSKNPTRMTIWRTQFAMPSDRNSSRQRSRAMERTNCFRQVTAARMPRNPVSRPANPGHDEELLAAYVATGSRDAFEELLRRYEGELYGYLWHFLGDAQLAEDVFQNTFLQVHLKCRQFEPGRRLRPWLYKIATSQAVDLLRRNRRHKAVSFSAVDDAATHQPPWHDPRDAKAADPATMETARGP